MNYANQAAQATTGGIPSIKPMTSFGEIINRLEATAEYIGQNNAALSGLADRAYGEPPPVATKEGLRPVPSGEVGLILEKINDLGELVSAQENIISRLQGLV